jgi:N-acetylmuramoyl-L-alanine amidase
MGVLTVLLIGAPAAVAAQAPALAGAGPLAGRTILVDPGHAGGNAAQPQRINRLVEAGGFLKSCDTVGTQTTGGYAEHSFNFDVATRLARVLRGRGATVVLTRSDDRGVGPCVDVRGRSGQRAGADLAISIHADGGPVAGRGFHVILPASGPVTRSSRALGMLVRAHLDRLLPRSTYTGVAGFTVRSDLAGLNLSTVPKVFVELGNMRNPADARQQVRPDFRQRLAVALADALAGSLG